MQVLGDVGKPADKFSHMSVYGWAAPLVNASKPDNEWQTMEGTIVGNKITRDAERAESARQHDARRHHRQRPGRQRAGARPGHAGGERRQALVPPASPSRRSRTRDGSRSWLDRGDPTIREYRSSPCGIRGGGTGPPRARWSPSSPPGPIRASCRRGRRRCRGGSPRSASRRTRSCTSSARRSCRRESTRRDGRATSGWSGSGRLKSCELLLRQQHVLAVVGQQHPLVADEQHAAVPLRDAARPSRAPACSSP